ncbi:hypothetical protein [Glycomyces artemisiae]|uniref:Uncharacterized protein n=1 Tax=Glycomyces artemisiae TaxID=1076443 RepID=A0A2T0UPD0_9ACTN|nr:hypothetical protein [Glycomyces artemisiae]PRY59792.1 hypothetical protein B0I28_103266 [Glycomyces artemisiae]
MPRPLPGTGALVTYIRTGDRDARTAYRDLDDRDRLAYGDIVRRVYATALAHHFGDAVEDGAFEDGAFESGTAEGDALEDFIEQIAARHPHYSGGVKRVLRSTALTGKGLAPRQVLTAQHLIIREIAKQHPGFRANAERMVASKSRIRGVSSGAEEHFSTWEFTGTDADQAVSVAVGLDGTLQDLALHRGVERLGGRTIAASLIRAWVAAEKRRWARAQEVRWHDAVPRIGSGKGGGDTSRWEAYSGSGLSRATVDRYGRVRDFVFMRAGLFGEGGRHGLAADAAEAVAAAQHRLYSSW